MFPRRQLNLLIIDTIEMPLKLSNNQRVAAASPPRPSILGSKIVKPSRYSSNLVVTVSINVVHYKQKKDRLQQMQEHDQFTEKKTIDSKKTGDNQRPQTTQEIPHQNAFEILKYVGLPPWTIIDNSAYNRAYTQAHALSTQCTVLGRTKFPEYRCDGN